MYTAPLETDVRTQVDKRLENLGWILDPKNPHKNVFQEQPKTEAEKKRLKGKRPDYVLYEKDKNTPLIIIETKKQGENINLALEQGVDYADILKAPIVFATDGVYCKSLHTKTGNPLLLNGEELDELIRELLAIKYLEADTNEVNTLSKQVVYSRQELINVFDDANNMLRVEGLRAGIERFSEFANILFLKLISETESIKEEQEGLRSLPREYCCDFFKDKKEGELLKYVNNIVLKEISELYKDDNIFTTLKIRDGKVLKRIIDKLDSLTLTDINSDIKGDAFEYFLKATTATGNDLGEYFTPRHVVKMMVKLVNPQIGEKVYDPFCGTGGLLIESYRHIYNNMARTETNVEQLQQHTVFGNEITNTARITKMNMILAGDGHSNIQMTNSIANPVNDKYDVVVTNMPYSQKTEHGGLYDLPTTNGDSICVQHCIRAINKTAANGRMAIIVPEGFLFRKDLMKTREYLLKNCNVQTVISLPQGVFLPYTGVKTNVLYCTKVKQNKAQKHYWYFDIKNDGYSLNSKRDKKKGENDVDKFLAYRNVATQEEKETLRVGFDVIAMGEVLKNDFILSANRYKEKALLSTKWEVVTLGDTDLFKVESGGTPNTKTEEYWNGKINWVTLIDMPAANLITEIKDTARKITKKGLDNSSAKLLPENSVLVSSRATIGRVAINKVPVATNQGYKNIIIKQPQKVLPEFVALMMTKLKETMEQMASGATFKEISKGDFTKLKIPLPPIKVQKEIVKNVKLKQKTISKKHKEIDSLNLSITGEINNIWGE